MDQTNQPINQIKANDTYMRIYMIKSNKILLPFDRLLVNINRDLVDSVGGWSKRLEILVSIACVIAIVVDRARLKRRGSARASIDDRDFFRRNR